MFPAEVSIKFPPYKNTYKLNPFQVEHDEYVLRLFSLLKRDNWGDIIELEQDYKKDGSHKNVLRVPDLLLVYQGGTFVFEYEKALKSDKRYERMFEAYENLDPHQYYFVFICENSEIASKLATIARLKYQAFIKPVEFLNALNLRKYEDLANYFLEETIRYSLHMKEASC